MKYIKYLIGVILIVITIHLIAVKNTILLSVSGESNIIDLKNPSIITKNNVSTFKATIVNNSPDNVYINYLEIIVRDASKNIICTFNVKIDKTIYIDGGVKIETSVNYDLSDAVSFDFFVNCKKLWYIVSGESDNVKTSK